MSTTRVRIEDKGSYSIIRAVGDDSRCAEVFLQVVNAVNRGLQLPESQRHGPTFRALYEEGPLLFNAVAIDPRTGESHSRLAGIQVTAARLPATRAALRARDVEEE